MNTNGFVWKAEPLMSALLILTLSAGAVFGTVEAVKTVSDLNMPVSGEVLEFNENLNDHPEAVNQDPYGEGWMIKISVPNPAELDALLDAEGYKAII